MNHGERPNYKEWETDFHDFLSAEDRVPPLEISEAVATAVRLELRPSALMVFGRLAGIVLASCIVSLAACPQFGLGFTHHFGLKTVFMSWFGHYGCEIACGAFFSAVGVLIASFVLRPEELRVLRATRFMQIAALSALFLGAFVCAGSEVLSSIVLLWFAGASLGGVLSLEAGYVLRFGSAAPKST